MAVSTPATLERNVSLSMGSASVRPLWSCYGQLGGGSDVGRMGRLE